MKTLAPILALALSVTPVIAQETVPRQISVTGEGRVDLAPDMAVITLGVTQQDRSAQIAMDRTSQASAAVLARLTELGLAPRDVQTSDLSLYPQQDHSGSGPAKITGFVASNTIRIRVRDLDQLGALLGAVLEDGANRFEGLAFTLQNPRPSQDEARKLAVADALRKAALLAGAAGVELGEVLSISEGGGGTAPKMMMRGAAAEISSDVPVAGGEVSVTQQVNVVISLR
ncbi:SIMPL domain-containing protein [Thalassovita taeanensis]|uniref:26 kDa periplasmic immunogenic protein n=1 Tax=Thalassovita taeanensis TaxID=657014 RepID=A0A1H9KJG3_9RHOB|nr:SIMPL domain-containing protein [Thalassovita taeanensis]SEQ99242.1 hypothetical protein SAMN04488092_1197 [Thalassovita taeanensis]